MRSADAGLGDGREGVARPRRHAAAAVAGILGRHPEGYRYSQFCEHFTPGSDLRPPTMRQQHRAGEALEVDYAGMTLSVIEAASSARRRFSSPACRART